MAWLSTASFRGVEEAWAFTWSISSGRCPAERSASRMAAAAWEPSGRGAVMWCASLVTP